VGAPERRARVRAGWTPPPGPLPRGDGGEADLVPADGETLDMLSGELRIFQRRDGHRFSTDDLLCAWFACARAAARGLDARRAMDLGTGIGSVAMMVAWKLPAVRLVAIEAQDVSVGLCARSLRYNGLSDRVELRHGDLREAIAWRDADAGGFDLVTGSPPYFDEAEGKISDRPQRGPCRFEQRGGVEAYAEAAAYALAPAGIAAFVHLWEARARVRAAAGAAGLAVTTETPVVLRDGREPHLGLFELARGASAPAPTLTDALVVRSLDDTRSAAWSAARLAMGFPP